MMDRIRPLLKTILLGLASLIAVLGLIMLPLMTCGKVAKAATTTLNFNQLVSPREMDGTYNGVHLTVKSDGTIVASGTSTSSGGIVVTRQDLDLVSGHKYLIYNNIGGLSSDFFFYAKYYADNPYSGNRVDYGSGAFFTATANKSDFGFYCSVTSGKTVDATIRPMCVDLTQMFGAGNEPTTVSEFKSYCPDEYYYFNIGTQVSINSSSDSYLLLDYLTSSGAQCIDTGYVPSSYTKMVHNASLAQGGVSQVVGLYDGSDGQVRRFDILSVGTTNYASLLYGSGTISGTNILVSVGSKLTSILDVANSNAYINGSGGTSIGTIAAPFQTSIGLFARRNTGVVDGFSNYAYINFYSAQIYEHGVLVRDYVPVKRSSDGTLGLLERVSGLFCPNAGSGNFTAGYLSHDYYVCDYIQTSGTQYIDTDYYVSNNSSLSLAFSEPISNIPNGYWVFGSRVGSNDNEVGLFYSAGNQEFVLAWGNNRKYIPSSSLQFLNSYLNKFTIDGKNYVPTSNTFTNTYSLYLGAIHLNTGAYGMISGKFAHFDIINNGIFQRNLIPVYDTQTNQAGFWDNINNQWYGNAGTGSFGYSITGGATIYQVNTENTLNSALSSSVAGDLIVMTSDITTSATVTTIGAAPVYFGSYSLNSTNHPNIILYTVEGWYSTKWTSKASEKLLPNTTYYARFQANISSGQNFSLALGSPVDGDILNITSTFTHTYESFTVPAGVTIDLNGYNILPPEQTPMTQVGYNSDPTATTASTSFTAGNTYYAIYIRPVYAVTLKVSSSATVDLTQLPAGATRTPSSTTGLDDITFTYTYGDSITFPNPVLTYYSFNGWYSNNQGPYSGINPTDYGVKVYEARWVTAPVIEIGNVKIFRKLSGTSSNDRLILFTYNITWGDYTPAYNVNTLFVFRLMDEAGTNTLVTTQVSTMGPNGGYEMGMGAFYFPDDSIIDWGEEYQIRIDGNPSMWYTISDLRAIYNITPANYTEASGHSDNQTAAGNEILSIYLNLEENWQGIYRLVTTTTDGDMVLTSGLGNQYTLDILPNAMSLVPDIFANKSTEHNPSELPNDDNTGIKNEPPELIQRWENQYDGTWVQTSFQALGDLFHVSWRLVTSLMCVALWVVLAAISQRRWGTTDAGMWAGAVVMGIGTTMGIMEWSIVGAAAILLALYGLYIVFWRQG